MFVSGIQTRQHIPGAPPLLRPLLTAGARQYDCHDRGAASVGGVALGGAAACAGATSPALGTCALMAPLVSKHMLTIVPVLPEASAFRVAASTAAGAAAPRLCLQQQQHASPAQAASWASVRVSTNQKPPESGPHPAVSPPAKTPRGDNAADNVPVTHTRSDNAHPL